LTDVTGKRDSISKRASNHCKKGVAKRNRVLGLLLKERERGNHATLVKDRDKASTRREKKPSGSGKSGVKNFIRNASATIGKLREKKGETGLAKRGDSTDRAGTRRHIVPTSLYRKNRRLPL